MLAPLPTLPRCLPLRYLIRWVVMAAGKGRCDIYVSIKLMPMALFSTDFILCRTAGGTLRLELPGPPCACEIQFVLPCVLQNVSSGSGLHGKVSTHSLSFFGNSIHYGRNKPFNKQQAEPANAIRCCRAESACTDRSEQSVLGGLMPITNAGTMWPGACGGRRFLHTRPHRPYLY